MPHPGHARRTVRKDPSAKRLGKPPAKKKSLGIKGAAGIISSKALKGIKWPGSPQASKLAMDVVGPGKKLKIGAAIAKKVAPKAAKRIVSKLQDIKMPEIKSIAKKVVERARYLTIDDLARQSSSLKTQIKKQSLRDIKTPNWKKLETKGYATFRHADRLTSKGIQGYAAGKAAAAAATKRSAAVIAAGGAAGIGIGTGVGLYLGGKLKKRRQKRGPGK